MKKETSWICGKPWTVEIIPKHLVFDGVRVAYGECQTATQSIRVTEKDVCRDTVRETTLHEVIHSMLKTVSNGFPSEEEDAVQALTVGFYSAFRDPRNLWLWQLLLEGVAQVRKKSSA